MQQYSIYYKPRRQDKNMEDQKRPNNPNGEY